MDIVDIVDDDEVMDTVDGEIVDADDGDDDCTITPAQDAALTLDFAYFERHPYARSYIRPQVEGEFGDLALPAHTHILVILRCPGIVERYGVETATDD